MNVKDINSGENLKIRIYFVDKDNNEYLLPTGTNVFLYFNKILVGSTQSEPYITIIDNKYYDVLVPSDVTITMSGYKDIILVTENNINGVMKSLVSGVRFNRLGDQYYSQTETNPSTYGITIKATYYQDQIQSEAFVYNALIGEKGDIGPQGIQGIQGEQGPQGIQGPTGATGATGKSSYQSYLDTTTDNPPMTEAQWANQIGTINAILDAINGESL